MQGRTTENRFWQDGRPAVDPQGCGLLERGGWTRLWTCGVRHNLRLILQRAERIMEHHAAKDY